MDSVIHIVFDTASREIYVGNMENNGDGLIWLSTPFRMSISPGQDYDSVNIDFERLIGSPDKICISSSFVAYQVKDLSVIEGYMNAVSSTNHNGEQNQ